MIEQFKKDLNKLLLKYPELPEFVLTIRPRVTMDIKSISLPQKIDEVKSTKEKVSNVDKGNIPLTLESTISKSRLDELAKSASIEK